MKKNLSLIIVLIAIAAIIIIIVTVGNKKPKVASAMDTFTQCLTDNGSTFYGAFWCPHCQNQKALFGDSVKLLTYKECSQANRKQNSMCTDAQIETYPTWTFSEGITITQDTAPIICAKAPGIPEENPICNEQTRSQYGSTWFFNGARIMSVEEPTIEGSTWKFPSSAQMRGEASLEDLGKQSNCPLPIIENAPVDSSSPQETTTAEAQ